MLDFHISPHLNWMEHNIEPYEQSCTFFLLVGVCACVCQKWFDWNSQLINTQRLWVRSFHFVSFAISFYNRVHFLLWNSASNALRMKYACKRQYLLSRMKWKFIIARMFMGDVLMFVCERECVNLPMCLYESSDYYSHSVVAADFA